MRLEAKAGAASAVLALILLLSTANATQPTLREVERRRAAAELDRKRLEAETRAAEGAATRLNRKLTDAGRARAAAEAEAEALESQAAALLHREQALDAEAAVATAGFERTLIALSRAERGSHAAVVAASTGRNLAVRANQASAGARLVHARRTETAARRAGLAVSQAQLDSSAAALRAELAEQQARQALLNADKNRAETRLAELARQARTLRDLVARAAPGRRATPALATQPTRLLATPATTVRRFGERLPGGAAQGVTLRTRPGAQILAPSAGKVAFSGPFRSYGIVLILDLDNGYAVVLTGMDTVSAAVGQRVRAGQSIAAMAPDASTAPELYVEVRRDGRPVDPARWLGGGA